MGRERDEVLDALRGLAVALVVLGHSIYDVAWVYHDGPGLVEIIAGSWVPQATAVNPALTFAYTFHTPLLAFVSGFVLWRVTPDAPLVQLRKRAIGLLLPYFSWALVYHLVDTLREGRSLAQAEPLSALSSATLGVGTTGPLWFLYALFLCCVVLIVAEQLPKTRWLLGVSALAAVAVSQIPAARTSTFALNQVLWIYPFFALGYLTARHRSWIAERRAVIGWVCGVAFVVLAYVQYPIPVPQLSVASAIDTYLDGIGMRGTFTIVRYAAALAGTLAATAVYLGLPHRVLAPQARLGRRTLGVFASSTLIGAALVLVGISRWPLVFAASLGLSYLASAGLERVPVARLLLLGKTGQRVAERRV